MILQKSRTLFDLGGNREESNLMGKGSALWYHKTKHEMDTQGPGQHQRWGASGLRGLGEGAVQGVDLLLVVLPGHVPGAASGPSPSTFSPKNTPIVRSPEVIRSGKKLCVSPHPSFSNLYPPPAFLCAGEGGGMSEGGNRCSVLARFPLRESWLGRRWLVRVMGQLCGGQNVMVGVKR